MAQKTIPDLQSTSSVDENTLLIIDSGIQTFKIDAQTFAHALRKLSSPVRSVSSGTTQQLNDAIVTVDTTSSPLTYTFLPAASWTGKKVTLKNLGTNLLTAKADGAETIDGSNTYTSMEAQYDSATFFSTGTSIITI